MRYDFEKEDKGPVVKKVILSLIIWFAEIAAVVGLAYFIANYALEKTVMPGDSMEKTLMDQDKIIINKFSYVFHQPRRFDVIVFKQSDKEHSYLNVKRIIGLPGETVQIKEGKIYINGEPLTEKIVNDPIENPGLAEEEIKLDENEFFVLGDNRNNSEDSRFANVGNIVSGDILGKAWIRQNGFAFINKLNIAKEEE
ncbi:signal peptidase I [Anaerocolumna xylanovorans]|uniref:Signal peptidase I n=1 Tax=Anaerocolumna xylanovorans DSM 12503 TaxID=1121345 RepID=A0A1M7Y292_9FIRM|nr:signal peptidase I [Anaerocolumna xylanovorans]SHO46060.1 signal peptidase I [Anaerocolumna xylanovorans DSM 12503]